MKKLLSSLFSIGVIAIVAIAASNAFFSDTETSVGNKFVAGDIDLKIDNTSYAFDYNIPGFQNPQGNFVASTQTTWTLRDLTVEKFFDFVDLKPGDYGEDTISVHAGSNDAWMCAAARLTEDQDNSCTDPEKTDDATCVDPTGNGELDEDVNFSFWVDDGDNVLETDEVSSIFLNGPLSGLGESGKIALADTNGGILGADTPIPGGTTFHIGKAWCFGSMTPSAIAEGDGTPLTRGTGFTCNGADVDNAAQTDSVVGDIQFYATQSRNNAEFSCDSWQPEWPQEPRPLVDGLMGDGEWEGCTEITIAGGKGTACVLAYPDYLYALYQINDPTDDRAPFNENSVGNDQLGLNINPDQAGLWGKPYDIILQTGTDPAAFTSPDPNPDNSSSGQTDNWESEWMNGNSQLALPVSVETKTLYYGITDLRISEWKLPLSSIAGLSSGDSLKVGGGVDIGDGSSYAYPSTLNWADPFNTFVVIPVN